MATPTKDRWRRFERIIAAIEFATNRGATVTWNENIEGRQFDVSVRFANGPHSYLTLIECKDQKNPVAVEKVDAFATKARDAKANKSVIISSTGFQRGCLDVARRHGIELFQLNERIFDPPGAKERPLEPVLGVYDFVIQFPGNRTPLPIPESNNRLDYLLGHGTVRLRGSTETLQNLLDRTLKTTPSPLDFEKPQTLKIALDGAVMQIPTLLEASPVKALTFEVIKQLKKVLPRTPMDPHLLLKLHSGFELMDCLQNKPATMIAALDLPIGFDTKFTAGCYYTSLLEQNYYCERVENGSVKLILVESYVHGNLIQASLGTKAETAKYYIEITDFPEIIRLQKMYQKCSLAQTRRPIQP